MRSFLSTVREGDHANLLPNVNNYQNVQAINPVYGAQSEEGNHGAIYEDIPFVAIATPAPVVTTLTSDEQDKDLQRDTSDPTQSAETPNTGDGQDDTETYYRMMSSTEQYMVSSDVTGGMTAT